MRVKKIGIIGIFLILIILTTSLISSYTRSYVQTPTFVPYTGEVEPLLFDRAMCGAGQDFLLQVSPTGCTPSVVRSDLLEDQNVPVFCPITATQLNPLIDIEAIYHMTFRGEHSPYVQGIHYLPARAALGRYGAQVNNPVLNNIGYAIIVLKQQKNASEMPDHVLGNLTAVMRYNIKNAFGVGEANFYLPELNDDEWENTFSRYSFWDGRGYLRAESIEENSATISIYSDRETYGFGKSGEKRKLSSTTLNLGERSPEIPMPGFDYCLGTMQLELNGMESPDTRIRLNVNGDVIEVKEKENFLDNKCWVRNIEKRGIIQKTTIRCDTDEGRKSFSLVITPEINLSINGNVDTYGVGDRVPFSDDPNKFVYVGYISTKEATDKKEDLYVRFVQTPYRGERLTEDMISEVARFDNDDTDSKDTDIPRKIIGFVAGRIQDIGQWLERYAQYIWKGSEISSPLEYGKKDSVFGAEVLISGFGEARDAELSGEFKDYYEKAMEGYEDVIDGFSSEKYPQTEENKKTLGEEALFNQIELTKMAGQKKATAELCEKFRKDYPNSMIPPICDETYKLSSPESAVQDVEIDGRVERISFEGIEEPDDKEYGARIIIDNAGECSGRWILGKEEETCLSDSEFIRLVKLDEEYAEFDVSSVQESEGRELFWKTNYLKIKLDDSHVIGKNNYRITVSKIYLKKLARVSVKPNIRHSQTNASFGFNIGIEKRAIKLSPEKTAEKIESLNKTISKWEKINNGLGKIVSGFKKACLVTGGFLTVKNFFANLGGKGIARNKVMRTPGVGWFEICETKVNAGEYSNVDSCLLDNNDAINAAVKAYTNAMKAQDNEFEILQKGVTKKSFLGEDVVNTDELMKRYLDPNYKSEVSSENYKNELSSNLEGKIETVRVGNKDVPVSDIIASINPDNALLTQTRDLILDSRLLSNENTTEIAQDRIESTLGDIWVNNEGEKERQDLESKYGLSSIIGSGRDLTEFSVTDIKTFGQTTRQFTGVDVDSASPVIIYKDKADAKEYLLVLDGDSVVQQTYLIGANNVLSVYKGENAGEGEVPNPLGLAFEYFDKTTYENYYDNAEIRYYETAPYKGLPAIVPFDVQNGWYAAIKSTLPVGKNIGAYDDSGRISSFWLCNVGKDGREEFNSGIGDDKCEMINLGTGQPYNQFHGLEAGEASKLVGCAVKAIEQASRAHTSGISRVKINTICGGNTNIKVGKPAINIPDIQCQDFMSPSECNLLFNVCDPVVCPSSRCDLGGAYPVKDVVQSGLAGSIFLCLPNFPEVKIPVCLSGIHASSEAYLSVLDSYQKCLQTSLDTGETVGICDEIYSIHMCEFFWRQALPLTKIAIPKIIGMVLGQNIRGGGEYLGVQDAWQRASDSVNYFAQYYAANSFKAFKARTAEGVGAEVCKTFVSWTTPQTGSLFDALVAPDSPPQFYGRFDEIPFTTATSPPTSHYKVFYHIYAGKDFPAYFQVYLKGTGSSFFQDASYRRIVAQGFIKAGEYETKTRDFTAPSGYQEMCIVVNGQEECGFKQVTTEFGINWLTDKYLQQQATQEVKTESACISGTTSLYSLVNPGLIGGAATGVGGAAEELVNPALYNRGITRICATDNPGKGTDANWQTNKSRWQPVGYCGNEKIKCWLDTNSVKDTIKITSIEEKVLDDVSGDYMDTLLREGGYVEDFKALAEEIEKEKDMKKRIEKIEENYDKVFYSYGKGYLTLLRADAYKELALAVKPEEDIEDESGKIGDKGIEEIWKEEEEKDVEAALARGTTSPVFRFKYDGVPLRRKSIYYSYFGENWYFSLTGEQIAGDWFHTDREYYLGKVYDPQGRLIDPYGKLSEEMQEFTDDFVNKSYKEGLELLISRTTRNIDKSFLTNVELSTDSVEFSHKERFKVVQKGDTTELYFEYNSEQKKWKWAPPDKKSWMFVPETIVEAGRWEGKKPVQANIDLIENLEGENYFDGAKIIFGIDALPFYEKAGLISSEEGSEEGESCPNPNPSEEVLELTKVRDRVLKTIEELEGKPSCLPPDASCHDSIKFVYDKAGVEAECHYSDKSGKSYIVEGETITLSDEEGSVFLVPRIGSTCKEPIGSLNYQQKLDKIEKGDWLNIAWPKKEGGVSSHAVIFISWVEPNKKARVFDWIGGGSRTYGYQNISLTENTHPVYLYRNPA